MRKIGLVINPVAGHGGPLAWKGTDGREVPPHEVRWSPRRAMDAIRVLGRDWDIVILTAAGLMGEEELRQLGLSAVVTYAAPMESTANDTKAACRSFLEAGAELIVFCGGDGTARDICDAVGTNVPVIGIPSGVKMHSGAFASTPTAAGLLIEDWLLDDVTLLRSDVVDVDEDEFRRGRVVDVVHGQLLTPARPGRLQPSKGQVEGADEDIDKWEIGLHIRDMFPHGVTVIIGPGSTLEVAARAMGVEKTPLGVDVYLDGALVEMDASEMTLMKRIEASAEVWIVVTPIGRQGFIFGRGNQQISADVISEVKDEHIVIAATRRKLEMTPLLMVDTGDQAVDERLRGHRKVLTGQGQWKMAFVV
jgi:predicted polyphosphate/ATP-dependent NAD kinase